jgi:DNA-binding transcriptional LysR family regulator
VNLSQPAVSNALARLRALLGDPLVERRGGSMEPTRRAREIAAPLKRILADLDATFAAGSYDPGTSTKIFTVSTSDYVELVFLPDLLAQLRRSAPRAKVSVIPSRGGLPATELADGSLDISISNHPVAEPPLQRQKLFSDDFVCVVGPAFADLPELTLEAYVAAEHLLVSPSGGGLWGMADSALAAQGLERHVAVTLPTFGSAAHLVSRSGLICTLPRRIAKLYASALNLRLFEPPVPVPGFDIALVWSSHFELESRHRFLRDVVRSTCAA